MRAWKAIGRPTDLQWTEYLRRWGGLPHIGIDTRIPTAAMIGDPELTWIGDNVLLSTCAIVGHDASASVLSRVYGEALAGVFGPTIIRDNVFIGYSAVILPGVTVGPNAIVGAGAVVTRDVPPDSVVVGVPARVISSVSELVERRRANTRRLPWVALLDEQHETGLDLTEAIRARRAEAFFSE